MKKLIFSVSTVLMTAMAALAQTTATDFTAADCSSTNHTLFTELNSGKVIVLAWVMPCGTCIANAKAAYDAAQSFATSNPGKVLYWLVDDFGNTSCTTLSSWASTNSIGPSGVTMFGNAGTLIDEADYGGTAMPHVVVIGGTDHHIYYNKKGGAADNAAITTAINQAIAASSTAGVNQAAVANGQLSLYPNPAKDKITVGYTLDQSALVSMEIYNAVGAKVKTIAVEKQSAGQQKVDIDFSNQLPKGVYSLKLLAGSNVQTVKFTIAE